MESMGDRINAYWNLVGGNETTRKRRRRLKDNIKMNLQEVDMGGGLD